MIIDKILSPSNQSSVKRKLDFRSLSPDLLPAAEVFSMYIILYTFIKMIFKNKKLLIIMSIILFSDAVNTIEEVIYTSSSPFKVSMTNATTTDNSALGMYSMQFTV